MSPKGASTLEPVSPEAGELYPNVQGSSSERGQGERDVEAEPNGKRQRVRLDRDTEVEVVTGVVPDEEPEEEDEKEEIFEEASGEKMRQVPKGPTQEEIRRHRATHCPYRSWCPKCVA